jgi:hypothetical protein
VTTASITAEMRAQVARELPEPPASFRNEAHRLSFQVSRELRFLTLQADIQWFLDECCADNVERQMTLDAYRDQSTLLVARN